MKSDNGLYDETDAYKKYIMKALLKAQKLKTKIKNLSKKYKKEFDARKIKAKIKNCSNFFSP